MSIALLLPQISTLRTNERLRAMATSKVHETTLAIDSCKLSDHSIARAVHVTVLPASLFEVRKECRFDKVWQCSGEHDKIAYV